MQTQMKELAQERQDLQTKLRDTQKDLAKLKKDYEDQKYDLWDALNKADGLIVERNKERGRRKTAEEDLEDLQSICSGQALSLSDGKKLFDEIHLR